MVESYAHLRRDEQGVGDVAERSKAGIIFNLVSHDGSVNFVAKLSKKRMAVMPGFKWALALNVFEVIVQSKTGDACFRRDAKRE